MCKKGSTVVKSRDQQKAHLRLLLIVPTNYSLLAQFGGELCEEQTQKIRKYDQKTTSLVMRGVEMGQKSLDPQKAHLGHLHPIWRGDRGETALFGGQ